jgi:hypothetical protein
MLTRSFWLSPLLLLALGCSGSTDASSGAGGSGGGGGGSGAGGSGGACGAPDVACPAEAPYPGSPCSLAESCQYPTGDGFNTWTYACESGRWFGEATCEGAIGGGCPIPPLAESCNAPFDGKAAGATIELGDGDPTKPFTPLADGAALPLVWGGQGSPMVPYRLRVSGVPSSCVRIETVLRMGSTPSAPTPNAIALHCGESLGVYSIFPIELVSCEPPMAETVELEIEVSVQGAGTVKKTVTVENPGCALPG